MTERQPDAQHDDRIARRLAALEAERDHAERYGGFARCYPAFAIALAAATFLPLYDPLVHKGTGFSWTFGSIWQILGDDNSGASMLGLLLFAVLVGLLTVATFVRRVSVGPLVSSGTIAAVLMLMILLKPAMPDPPPDIGYGGEAALGILALIIVCTATHASLLVKQDRDTRGRTVR